MPVEVESTGDFSQIESFLDSMTTSDLMSALSTYGERGVSLLSNATPRDTGLTAESWYYDISSKNGIYTISWHNSHVEDGRPIAILLQYGHGTGTGGYVEGHDYINPAMQPLFDQIAEDVWKVVTSS